MIDFRFGLLFATLLLLGGCSWFGGDDDEEEEVGPAPLIEFEEEADFDVVWSERVGAGLGERYNRLLPAIVGDVIYAADAYGLVEARDRATGDRIWQTRVGRPLDGFNLPFMGRDNDDGSFVTGGLAADDFTIFLGTIDSDFVALRTSDGGELWRVQLSSEVLAPAAMDEERVFVGTGDGRLRALSRSDGSAIWSYDTQVPVLSLRGDSAPVLGGPVVLKGFASGKLSALRAEDGQLVWEHRVALPTGRSELDRIADIDSAPLVSPAAVFVGSYAGVTKSLRFNDGTVQWEQAIATSDRLAEGYGQLYVTDELDGLRAIDQNTGASVWDQDGLSRRQLTGPVVVGPYLVVGDQEGYLHAFAQSDGRPIARMRFDREGVRIAPRVAGDVLYVLGNSGRLAALRLQRR